MAHVLAYIASAIVFLGLDYLWLGRIAGAFYRNRLGHLMADNVNFAVAGGFYAFYVVGIVIFAIQPAFRSGAWTDALLYGALFGFFAYATYDITNLATLRDWPVTVAVVDVIWGTVLTGTAAVAGYLAARSLI
uniref:DUF2177 family protein n=1 Tax=Stappia sp. TaxID=1870903 RepID=UPI003BACE643